MNLMFFVKISIFWTPKKNKIYKRFWQIRKDFDSAFISQFYNFETFLNISTVKLKYQRLYERIEDRWKNLFEI